jgi:hypothetical protein
MSELQHILNQCQNFFIEIRPSKIVKGGVGLVAIRSIPKNTTLFVYKKVNVYHIKYDELKLHNVPNSVIKVLKKYYAHNKKSIQLPVNIKPTTYLYYLNHSPKSNIYYNYKTGEYITKRSIKKNEEIFIDYNENNYCPECIDFKVL